MRHLTAATLAVAFTLSAPLAQAASLYGTNFGGTDDFFSIDTASGAASSTGNTGNTNIGDLTSDTRAGSATIWGVDLGSVNNLLELDVVSGVASVATTITGAAASIVSIAYDEVSNTLYGNTSSGFGGGPDQLYTIDVVTGMATSVGIIGFDNVFALSFDTSGNLFGISDNTDQLLSIDTGTGAGSVIGATGVNSVFDLAYDPDSDAFFASGAGVDSLFSVDTGTGALSLIGSYSNGNATNVAGLAFGVAAIPVPASLPLLLLGLGAFGVMRRRKTG